MVLGQPAGWPLAPWTGRTAARSGLARPPVLAVDSPGRPAFVPHICRVLKLFSLYFTMTAPRTKWYSGAGHLCHLKKKQLLFICPCNGRKRCAIMFRKGVKYCNSKRGQNKAQGKNCSKEQNNGLNICKIKGTILLVKRKILLNQKEGEEWQNKKRGKKYIYHERSK